MGRDLSRNHSIKPTFEHCEGLVRKTKCFENQFYLEISYGKLYELNCYCITQRFIGFINEISKNKKNKFALS